MTPFIKTPILIENGFFFEKLLGRVRQFVDFSNHKCYYEPLNNLTPADVFLVVANQYRINAKK